MLPENSLEGDYHGPFIHRIAFDLQSRLTGLNMSSLYENEVPDVIRYLPGGHMVEDYRGASMSPPQGQPSAARRAYQDAMRSDCIAAIEDLAGRTVIAFMSANHIDPDLAAEIFVLEPRPQNSS